MSHEHAAGKASGITPGARPAPTTSDDQVTPDSLPTPVTDLLAAIAEALDLPLPSTDLADEQAYRVLLVLRASHVRILLEAMLDHPHVAIDEDAADVRTHIAQNPVTYTTFDEEKATAETRGEDR